MLYWPPRAVMLYNKGGVTIMPYKTASNLFHIKPKKTTKYYIVKKEDNLLSTLSQK